MIVDCDVWSFRPERLKVALHILNNGGTAHTIEVNVQNGNRSTAGIVGRVVLDRPIDGNLFPIAGVYHVSCQGNYVPLAIADSVDTQRVSNAESSRFPGAKFAPARSTRTAF